jgi:hypothetical protein
VEETILEANFALWNMISKCCVFLYVGTLFHLPIRNNENSTNLIIFRYGLVAEDGGLGGAYLSPIVALALGKSLSPFDEAPLMTITYEVHF